MQQGGVAEKEPEDLAEKQLCFPMSPLTGDLHLGHTSLQPAFTHGSETPSGCEEESTRQPFTKNSHFSYSNILNKCI